MNQTAQIAQDALAQLKAGKLKATEGFYIVLEHDISLFDLTGAQLAREKCHVCAQGALIVGLLLQTPDEVLTSTSDRRIQLRNLLGETQFELIEACFEGYTTFFESRDFYNTYPKEHERLTVILENIVRNDGEFRPKQDMVWDESKDWDPE